jgi:hypothetical protein
MAQAPAISVTAVLLLSRKALVLFVCGAVPWMAILWTVGAI